MVFSAPCTEYKPYLQIARDAHKKLEEERRNMSQTDSVSITAPQFSQNSVKALSRADIIDIINGSAAFAGGGGGSKQYGMLILEDAVQLTSESNVCSQISIQDLEDKDGVVPFAFMGKPTAIQETPQMLPVLAQVTIQAYAQQFGRDMKFVCGVEVGPTNSVAPMFAAAYANSSGKECYVLDGDLQGRAVLSLSMLGPYMMGVPMKGNCFAYVSKDGNPIPNLPVLSKGSYVANGVIYYVYGSVTPDNVTTASETENYLGNVIGQANPNSCLAVAFAELTKEVLLSQKYCSGVKAQIFTPNTLSRSRAMGMRLRTLTPYENPWEVLQEHNAVFLASGKIPTLTFPSDSGDRSDVGVYTMNADNGFQYAGIFNNETVQFGLVIGGGAYIFPILNAPSAITIQTSAGVQVPEFRLEPGECLTNDELTLFFSKYSVYLKTTTMTVVAMPPAPFLTSNEALAMIGPKSWGLPTRIGNFNIETQDYIPIPATYKAPKGVGFVQLNPFGQVTPFDPNVMKTQMEELIKLGAVKGDCNSEEARDN